LGMSSLLKPPRSFSEEFGRYFLKSLYFYTRLTLSQGGKGRRTGHTIPGVFILKYGSQF
jgi:hypothetical protein